MEKSDTGADHNESMEPLNASPIEAVENSGTIQNSKEQSLSSKDENAVPNELSHDSNAIDPSTDVPLRSLNNNLGQDPAYPTNVYAPQAQTFVYGGYENTKWEEYPPHFFHAEGMEGGSTGIYNENQSVMFHTGFGYNPHMPYGPYSPVTTPLPAPGGDGQLYSTQNFHFTGPYYQQPTPSNMPYLHTPTPKSQTELTMAFDRQDWLKSPDGSGSLTPLLSPAASPQPTSVVRSFGLIDLPFASGMPSQQQRPYYGFGSSKNSCDQEYFCGGMYLPGCNFGRSFPTWVDNGRNLTSNDKGRRRVKGNFSANNSCYDFLNEQNRGPRATKSRNASIDQSLSADSKTNNVCPGVNRELYNKPDFAIEYKDAKFFIIKSYSEDNVHKSIKYGVWASTINGNKKLDAAYRETKEKGDSCPVFLFFSFCGVAQMIGPVDFDRSVDYWQQDKWTGQFPVEWHIIKDCPNSLFRHIILENNENKPVTNSRDTQEVKLEQGLEMLSIIKKHDSDSSILDDFGFYEDREKALQERKAWLLQQRQKHQQQSFSSATPTSVTVEGGPSPGSMSDESIGQITSNFSQVVRLEKPLGEGPTPDRSNAAVAISEDLKKEINFTNGSIELL
ncbi:hypothetical protein HPP92_003380 [Vanilla planifolia]|uniref:YTH domain-containing family protein n=1 Tax=Vanilla planifolia TaxID=51239 RepID=A0A835S640_VANPL|nr:hypothetical protein HPP92_003380 [Vanilla planifolia]